MHNRSNYINCQFGSPIRFINGHLAVDSALVSIRYIFKAMGRITPQNPRNYIKLQKSVRKFIENPVHTSFNLIAGSHYNKITFSLSIWSNGCSVRVEYL